MVLVRVTTMCYQDNQTKKDISDVYIITCKLRLSAYTGNQDLNFLLLFTLTNQNITSNHSQSHAKRQIQIKALCLTVIIFTLRGKV